MIGCFHIDKPAASPLPGTASRSAGVFRDLQTSKGFFRSGSRPHRKLRQTSHANKSRLSTVSDYDSARGAPAAATTMGIPQKSTKTKTRRRTRDLDQITADLRSPKHLAQHKGSKAAEDLPGLGQYYCIECAKWFESEHSLVTHRKGSTHRRRLKALKDEPYTQKEAEAAIGLRTDNGPRQTARESAQDMEVEMDN